MVGKPYPKGNLCFWRKTPPYLRPRLRMLVPLGRPEAPARPEQLAPLVLKRQGQQVQRGRVPEQRVLQLPVLQGLVPQQLEDLPP
jgi:hypothetical protein